MNENDPIETLLKSTGRRPAVGAQRTERVRDVVRGSWMLEVSQRARRRRIGWAVSLASAAAVIAAVGIGSGLFPPSVPPVPAEPSGVSVERVVNDPVLVVGSVLLRGASVTTGTGTRVALRAATGHSVRLDELTTLRVVSGDEFVLSRGAVYVDARRDSAPGTASIRIETPAGTIEDIGTQYEARLDGDTLSLRVREGTVVVQQGSDRHRAGTGQSLLLDASGRATLTESSGDTQAWTWAGAIAPMMDIQGRSLQDFLRWVVRERGASLRYAEPALAAKASSIVLRGSIAGMTLEEATEDVIATSGLRHRWEEGVLIVGP